MNLISRHLLSALLLTAATANAAVITPDFANVLAGWATDRYAPNSFSDVPALTQGRSDVLGIGISSAQSLANRPSAYPIFTLLPKAMDTSSPRRKAPVLSFGRSLDFQLNGQPCKCRNRH